MTMRGTLLKGPSHEDGGIPGRIKETNQPIEVEGDEMIINKRSTRIKQHIVCKGTGEGIGSALNELGGGKKWSDEGSCQITETTEQFKKGKMIPKLENAVVFDNGGETLDRYTILIKPTGEVLGASENPFHGIGQHVGNVTSRMNVTFGYGWREGRDEKSIKRIIKSEVENYINEAKREGHLGKEVKDLNSLPEGVKKFIMQEQEQEEFADGTKIRKGDKELFERIKSGGPITENEVNLIKNRMNNNIQSDLDKEIVQYIWDHPVRLTDEQNQKGIDFLKKLWKTPAGKERLNNPFGQREEQVLDNFSYFDLVGYHDISIYGGRPFYVPIYGVVSKDGDGFQYYYDRSGVNIIGKKGMKVGRTKTKTITVFRFDELSDKAKKKAINDNLDFSVNDSWWDNMYEDAAGVGIKIKSFDIDRGNNVDAEFENSAAQVAESIIENHGKKTDTYRHAKEFLSELNELTSKSKNIEDVDESKIEDLEDEFRKNIEEDYLQMLKNEFEYLTSEESISELLIANEMEFMEDGSPAKFRKGTKISSHINKTRNARNEEIQRMIIRDGKLKRKMEHGDMVELNREDKLIKINKPQDFAIVSFLKNGSYPSGLKVFKHDAICIYKSDPELIEFLNKYKIAYSEFDNYEEFYEWLTNKLTASTKNKL